MIINECGVEFEYQRCLYELKKTGFNQYVFNKIAKQDQFW